MTYVGTWTWTRTTMPGPITITYGIRASSFQLVVIQLAVGLPGLNRLESGHEGFFNFFLWFPNIISSFLGANNEKK